jgi:hypothetical protein
MRRELQAAVVGLGAGRQHFDHQLRRFEDHVGAQVSGVAGDEHIGIYEAVVGRLHFHAPGKHLARAAAQGALQSRVQVGNHPPMHASSTDHRKHLAAMQLMLVGLLVLPEQEVLQRQFRQR